MTPTLLVRRRSIDAGRSQPWRGGGNRPVLPLIATVAIVWGGTVDIATRIPFGPLSLSGFLTVGVAVSLLAIAPAILLVRHKRTAPAVRFLPGRLNHHWVPFSLTVFTTWAVVRLLISPSIEGVQNVSVYAAFTVGISATAASSRPETAERVHRAISKIGVLASLVYLVTLSAGHPIFDPRPFALAALIFLSVTIPNKPSNRLSRLAPYLIVLAVVVSLSRTAAVIATAMLIFLILRGAERGHVKRSLVRLLASSATIYVAVTRYQPMRDRFLGGDAAYAVGGVRLNTSGRSALWQLTLDSANTSPLTGHGPGSASELIIAHFPNVGHPHNEYLRIYHDFGLVGVCLFVVAYLLLLGGTYRRAHRENLPVHWTPVIALLAIGACAVTDNAFVYPFVMLPLSVLIGLSLAHPLPNRRTHEGRCSPARSDVRESQKRNLDRAFV